MKPNAAVQAALGWVALGITGALSCGHARADASGRALFILDASGSMGSISADQRTRFDHAKDQVTQKAAQYGSQGFEMGLYIFGHRRGGCDDIELKVPMESHGSSDDVGRAISGLSPRGSTPLARTIQEATQYIKQNHYEGVEVVVVSDGEDTCGGNAVAAAHDLYAQTHSRINIIGMDIPNLELGTMAAIAGAGGGTFTREYTGTAGGPVGIVSGPKPQAPPTRIAPPQSNSSALPGTYSRRLPRPRTSASPGPSSKQGREGAPDDSTPIIDPNSIPREMSFSQTQENKPEVSVTQTPPQPPRPPAPPPKSTPPAPIPSATPSELPVLKPLLL